MNTSLDMNIWDQPDYQRSLEALGLSAETAAAVSRTWPIPGSLRGASETQLRHHGVTPTQARRIRGAFDIARLAGGAGPRTQITGVADIADLLAPTLGWSERELLAVVMLTSSAHVVDISVIAVGSITAVSAHPREVFRDVIRAGATSIILAHNHPGGDPEPSDADIVFTREMVLAGQMLGIKVLDHVVIGRGGTYFSMTETGRELMHDE